MVPQVLILSHGQPSLSATRQATSASGWAAVFAEPDETPVTAAERLCPAYILVDASHPAASNPALYLAASRLQGKVVLYSRQSARLEMRRLAVRFGVTTVDVACDALGFAAAVEHRLDAEEWLAGWLYTRRLVGTFTEEHEPDLHLI